MTYRISPDSTTVATPAADAAATPSHCLKKYAWECSSFYQRLRHLYETSTISAPSEYIDRWKQEFRLHNWLIRNVIDNPRSVYAHKEQLSSYINFIANRLFFSVPHAEHPRLAQLNASILSDFHKIIISDYVFWTALPNQEHDLQRLYRLKHCHEKIFDEIMSADLPREMPYFTVHTKGEDFIAIPTILGLKLLADYYNNKYNLNIYIETAETAVDLQSLIETRSTDNDRCAIIFASDAIQGVTPVLIVKTSTGKVQVCNLISPTENFAAQLAQTSFEIIKPQERIQDKFIGRNDAIKIVVEALLYLRDEPLYNPCDQQRLPAAWYKVSHQVNWSTSDLIQEVRTKHPDKSLKAFLERHPQYFVDKGPRYLEIFMSKSSPQLLLEVNASGANDYRAILSPSVDLVEYTTAQQGDTLFWALTLSLLIPCLDKPDQFHATFLKLFGDNVETLWNQVFTIMRNWDQANTPLSTIYVFNNLVSQILRRRVVDSSENNDIMIAEIMNKRDVESESSTSPRIPEFIAIGNDPQAMRRAGHLTTSREIQLFADYIKCPIHIYDHDQPGVLTTYGDCYFTDNNSVIYLLQMPIDATHYYYHYFLHYQMPQFGIIPK